MNLINLEFNDVPQLSFKDKAYINNIDGLEPFFKYAVSIEAFEHIIKDKAKDNTDRSLLIEALKQQYQNVEASSKSHEQIEKLASKKTFTVTTAHQPSLFTGPLYYVYKIISTLNLAETLNNRYVSNQFVPIFWIGGEDHDFEEINHVNLFGKTITWNQDKGGSVGQLSIESLKPSIKEIEEILGDSPNAQYLKSLINSAFSGQKTYGEAMFDFTRLLFKNSDLLIINGNQKALKKAFTPFIKKEIFENFSKNYVESTQKELEAIGFSAQAHSRAINFFYTGDGFRSRIVFENEKYRVIDTDISWTKAELEQDIDNWPERFSPNVVMRPIYQEFILPNLAYIGGGGEIAYWLERKTQFDAFNINFPMLIRRDSVMWIDHSITKKLVKMDISIPSIFKEEQQLIKEFVNLKSDYNLNFDREKDSLSNTFDKIRTQITKVDASLEMKVNAELQKALKSIDMLQGKMLKAEKQKLETQINQISKIKDKLFPKGGLQERKENFMSLYIKYGDSFLDTLKEHLNPLDKRFKVFIDL